jgi:hypothetical protein
MRIPDDRSTVALGARAVTADAVAMIATLNADGEWLNDREPPAHAARTVIRTGEECGQAC